MLNFTGQFQISLDANGRCKLPPKILKDFSSAGGEEVVMHCLPEGCLGIYPEKNWSLLRQELDSAQIGRSSGSMLARRSMRRFGALTQTGSITNQGRVTIPSNFRQICKLEGELVLVGSEIGVELWSEENWQREMELIMNHALEKGAMEIEQDLNPVIAPIPQN